MTDNPKTTSTLSKWQRRYRRLRDQGRCAHCGKTSAPYFECESRHLYKNISRLIDRMHAQGSVEAVGSGWRLTSIPYRGKNIRHDDVRHLPRMNNKPINEDEQLRVYMSILAHAGRGLTTQEVVERYVATRRIKQ